MFAVPYYLTDGPHVSSHLLPDAKSLSFGRAIGGKTAPQEIALALLPLWPLWPSGSEVWQLPSPISISRQSQMQQIIQMQSDHREQKLQSHILILYFIFVFFVHFYSYPESRWRCYTVTSPVTTSRTIGKYQSIMERKVGKLSFNHPIF